MKYLAILMIISISGCAMKSPMVVSPTGDGKYWVLQQDLEYEHPDTNKNVVIPRGFVTDLASVPRLFWVAFPPCGKYTSAAVLHDYLYWVQSQDCDRKCADDVLLLAMKEADVDLVTRESIYNAVRLGGSSSWNNNAKLKSSGTIRNVPEEFMNFDPYDTWEQIETRISNGVINEQAHNNLINHRQLAGWTEKSFAFSCQL